MYLPWINWGLYFAVVVLVLGFGTSSALAAAYGIAVTGTMAIDSILIFFVMRKLWHWPLLLALPISAVFLTVDLAFFGANLPKIPDGGWFPVVVGILVFTLLSTWKRGARSCSSGCIPAPLRSSPSSRASPSIRRCACRAPRYSSPRARRACPTRCCTT